MTLPLTERNGDMVPVTVMAADGPVIILHTPEEYATLWRGVDPDACARLENDGSL